jgi:hypothetical protein
VKRFSIATEGKRKATSTCIRDWQKRSSSSREKIKKKHDVNTHFNDTSILTVREDNCIYDMELNAVLQFAGFGEISTNFFFLFLSV